MDMNGTTKKLLAASVKESIDEEEGNRVTCEVCYCDYQKEEMRSLACEHSFCQYCVKEALESSIKSGKAIKITCMQRGCPEEFKLEHVEKYCSKDLVSVYKTIVQDVVIGTNKKIKRCPTPDC